MKTGDLVKQFGVSGTTIRRWVIEFEKHLSPGSGRQRSFTKDDYLVMATIFVLSNDGLAFKAIHKKLDEGYRVEDAAAETIGYTDGRMVPAAAVEQIIDAAELRTELEQVKAERDKLADLLLEARDTSANLRDKNDELNERIIKLERELGRAETEARMLREQQDKKRGWFGRG